MSCVSNVELRNLQSSYRTAARQIRNREVVTEVLYDCAIRTSGKYKDALYLYEDESCVDKNTRRLMVAAKLGGQTLGTCVTMCQVFIFIKEL